MWLYISTCAFLLALGLNTAISRSGRARASSITTFFFIGSALGVGMILSAPFLFDRPIEAVAAVATYGALCALTMLLLALSLASVSVYIILLLFEHPRSERELETSYSQQRMLALRFERIGAGGLIKNQQDRIFLTPKGELLLKCFILLRYLFGHKLVMFLGD